MKKIIERSFIIDRSGFTLVELLVTITIFSIIVAATAPLFKQGEQFFQITQSQTELRQNLDIALSIMSKKIREANVVVGTPNQPLPAANPGDTVFSCSDDTSNSTFVLRKVTGGNCAYINYESDSISEPVTSTTLIKITSARVSESSGGWDITITGKYEGPSAINENYKELTVQTTVFPRNIDGVTTWNENN